MSSEFWTGVAVVVSAIVTALGGYLATRLRLKQLGITAADAARLSDRAQHWTEMRNIAEAAREMAQSAREEATAARADANEARREVEKIMDRNRELEIENGALQKRIGDLEIENKVQKLKIEEMRKEIDALRAELSKHEKKQGVREHAEDARRRRK